MGVPADNLPKAFAPKMRMLLWIAASDAVHLLLDAPVLPDHECTAVHLQLRCNLFAVTLLTRSELALGRRLGIHPSAEACCTDISWQWNK